MTYFRMDPEQSGFFLCLEEDEAPFFLAGDDEEITVFNYPFDALRHKYACREASVLVLPHDGWSELSRIVAELCSSSLAAFPRLGGAKPRALEEAGAAAAKLS